MSLPDSETDEGNTNPSTWRLSMADLLRWTALTCVFLALVKWLGAWAILPGAVLSFGYVLGRFRLRGDQWVAVDCLLLISSIAVLGYFLTPNLRPHPPNKQGMCLSRLKQIAFALEQYHTTHGRYPPAYFTDQQGLPTHSWRAMILGELGHPELAAKYRWDEPWDGPNNRQLHRSMVHLGHCPSDSADSPEETSYLAVVGPDTVFPGSISVQQDQIRDGGNKTLLVVEVHDSGIGWFEPRDLHVTQMASTINARRGQGLRSGHNEGAHAAFVDCGVYKLPDDLPAEQLRGMLTIDGGEEVTLP